MPTDRTGAATEVHATADRFTIDVGGAQVGVAEFADRDGRRVFFHTAVEPAFEGRGLATILIGAALAATRDDNLRIVAVCSAVVSYLERHGESAELVDPLDRETARWLRQR